MKKNPLEPLEAAIDVLGVRIRKLVHDEVGPEAMARLYVEVRGLYDAMEEMNKKISDLKRQMAEEIIPKAFDDSGITTITLKEGLRVTISALVRASTRDMEAGIAWMKKHGYKDIVRETINASTLSALARDLATQGKELPEQLFNVYVGTNTSVTKVK
jgi:hypothetical protein